MSDYNWFGFHKLNEGGQANAKAIQDVFEVALFSLNNYLSEPRTAALVRTKLEEACFYAKKSMALSVTNQVIEDDESQPELPLE